MEFKSSELCLYSNDILKQIFEYMSVEDVNVRRVCKKWRTIYNIMHNFDHIRKNLYNIVIDSIFCHYSGSTIFGGFVRRYIAKENIYNGDIDAYTRTANNCDELIALICEKLRTFLSPYDKKNSCEFNVGGFSNNNNIVVKIVNMPIGVKIDLISNDRGLFDCDFNVNTSYMTKRCNIFRLGDDTAWTSDIKITMDYDHNDDIFDAYKTKTLKIFNEKYFETFPSSANNSNYEILRYFFKTLKISSRLIDRIKDGWKCSNTSVLKYFDYGTRKFTMPCCHHVGDPKMILEMIKHDYYMMSPYCNKTAKKTIEQIKNDDIECPFCSKMIAHEMMKTSNAQ